MTYHPLFINWKDKNITLIGGGSIAERKLLSLLNIGANITVISPSLTSKLQALTERKCFTWHQRKYEVGDVKDAFFVIAATNHSALNADIVSHCAVDQLTLNVSDHLSSNTIMPAIIKRPPLQIAISTTGASPHLAKKIRDEINHLLDQLFLEEEMSMLFEKRKQIVQTVKDEEEKQRQLVEIANDVFSS